MVISKLAEIVSSAAAHLSASKAHVLSYKSPGLSPIPHSCSTTFSIPEKNSNLRLAASLQDLSAYRQLDLEDDLSREVSRSSSDGSPPHHLLQPNGSSSFFKEKVSPIYSARNKWVRVSCALLGLLLFGCLCFTLILLYSNLSRGPSKFFVVLDCGSTGTRVYVYQASINRNRDNNLPILLKSMPESFRRKSIQQSGRAYNRMETEPGFDKLVRNISGLRKAIRPLIRWAEKQVPKRSHKTTSLFLYATAGVRRLPSSDSDWLLNNAWSIIKDSPFLCKKEWVKIITGMEEAYYGWIALNYHTGVLGTIPKKETYGSLDLGGSSLQVTFEGNVHENEQTSLELSIGPVNHHLSAYSLAGFGLNDAFDRSVAHLLKRLPQVSNADLVRGKVQIRHPCLQSGYKEQYSCSHCALIPLKDGSPVGRKRLGKRGKSGVPVWLVGSPKWEECSALAKIAINLSEWLDHSPGLDCELQPCALAENLPRPVGQFYAMSGFYVVYRFFNLTPDAALDDLLEYGREFCEKTWDVARKSVAPQPFIEQYCFRAPYVVLLLREGLHITDGHVIIGSGSITWTLGVALFEAGKVFAYSADFYSYQIVRVKMHPVIVFAILLLPSLFILFCIFSFMRNSWLPKFFRRPYLPLLRHNSATSTAMLNIPAPFRFQRWSPINTGDGRIKMPLSPTVSSTQQQQQSPFESGFGFGNRIQFSELALYSSSSSVVHSYSSGSIGQTQFDHSSSLWAPHRSQMQLQSRRSQSRDDLNSSIAAAEAHFGQGVRPNRKDVHVYRNDTSEVE